MNRITRNFACFSACLLLLLLALPARAALLDLTYSISASDFRDSNDNPPTAPTSNSVSGTLTFTIDVTLLFGEQDNIAPLVASGFDITKNTGALIDHNEANSLVDFNYSGQGFGRVLFGASVSSNDFMVGLSDDFRVQFNVDPDSFEVLDVFEHFTFNSTNDAFFIAEVTNIGLVSVSPTVVPLPAAGWLLFSSLLVLGGACRARRAVAGAMNEE